MSDNHPIYTATKNDTAWASRLAGALNRYLESLGADEAEHWHPVCFVDKNGKGLGNLKSIRVGTYQEPGGRQIPGMLLIELGYFE
jgi:hypothetical protein